MSIEERDRVIGQAVRELAEAKRNAAAASALLHAYVRGLEETSRSMARFLSDPLSNPHLADSLAGDVGRISDSRIPSTIEELIAETKRAAQLQRQVEEF